VSIVGRRTSSSAAHHTKFLFGANAVKRCSVVEIMSQEIHR
jgi:hypothetical protein